MNPAGIALKLSLLAIPAALSSCSKSSTKSDLARVMHAQDPASASASLDGGIGSRQRRAILPDQTEIGLLTLGDGSQVKYWFRSHHLTQDAGGTWFLLSSGERLFMEGKFCCEVDIPAPSLASPASLKDFIAKNDGVRP